MVEPGAQTLFTSQPILTSSTTGRALCEYYPSEREGIEMNPDATMEGSASNSLSTETFPPWSLLAPRHIPF